MKMSVCWKNTWGACFCGTDFEVGDAVFVREGPLTGLRGVIDRLDRKKLHIHVDAIPGSVMIDVEPHQVQTRKRRSLLRWLQTDRNNCSA